MSRYPMPSARELEPDDCHVVELRNYALHPGRREVLIDLFDREFVETQEARGMCVLGQFRDIDDSDSFVWLRGFADMTSRRTALKSFYEGPVWEAHKDRANATMLNSDDVLLLRPATRAPAFSALAESRPPVGATGSQLALITATIHSIDALVAEHARRLFVNEVDPLLQHLGSRRISILCTETATNTYPDLPVRQEESVIVRLARFDSAQHHARHHKLLVDSRVWRKEVLPQLNDYLNEDAVELRLRPTPRSRMR